MGNTASFCTFSFWQTILNGLIMKTKVPPFIPGCLEGTANISSVFEALILLYLEVLSHYVSLELLILDGTYCSKAILFSHYHMQLKSLDVSRKLNFDMRTPKKILYWTCNHLLKKYLVPRWNLQEVNWDACRWEHLH